MNKLVNRIFGKAFFNVSYALILILYTINLQAQHNRASGDTEGPKKDKSNDIRIAGLIGHTLIKSEGTNSHLFIPSWGFDIEYWFSHTWGIGLHNDIEIETFVIKAESNEEIKRVNPIVITVDALYRFHNGIVFTIGPGIEWEKDESFLLCRLGMEYEKDIGNDFDIVPSFYYDQRIHGFATYTVALGIGKRF